MREDSQDNAPAAPGRTPVYVLVWVLLIGLTAVTAASARGLEGGLGVLAPVVVASLQAVLVLLYFMHLKDEAGVVKAMFWVVVAALIVVFLLLFSDVAFR
ncbi:MAG: cytochrome C oxidase subunit IV family protein [Thermodesulfobacteriota bacterium]